MANRGDVVQADGEVVVDHEKISKHRRTEPIFHVVLYEPEIAANTGNIARTCAATGCRLHLIEPLGFTVSDRYLKRAGLDYWQHVDLEVHASLSVFLEHHPQARDRLILFTTKARRTYDRITYHPGAYFLYGKETSGLPDDVLALFPKNQVRIPMLPGVRSLNLGNSVALSIYEALRQLNFPGLE